MTVDYVFLCSTVRKYYSYNFALHVVMVDNARC